ncbi:MAG: hypothetical protein ACREAA_04830 [Candidatus Polarisedimenticolia bacterium]
MKIKLDQKETDLLQSLALPDRLLLSLRVNGGADMSPDEWRTVLDACIDDLQIRGFDSKDEPTERGMLLEGIIDKIEDPDA